MQRVWGYRMEIIFHALFIVALLVIKKIKDFSH